MRSETGADAVVIGAGAIGCAVAWRLAQAGLAVALLDRGEPGSEASSAAAGILGAQMESHGPGPLLALQLASRALFPALAEELREATGLDVRCRIEGVLELAFSEPEAEALRARQRWQAAAGLRAEWLEQQQLEQQQLVQQRYDLESQPSPRPPAPLAGLLFPDDGQVDNRLLARALRLAAERARVSLLRAEALEVLGRAGRICGVRIRDGRGAERTLSCSSAVVAAGSWSALLPGARIAAGAVRPVRGQMLALALPRLASSQVLACSTGYAVPRGERLLIGATVEEAGFDKQVTEAGLAALRATLARLAPRYADAPIAERWCGLRPAPRDGLPLLGAPALGPRGLFVCTGHYRSGILLTPLSARLLRDAVLEKPPAHDLAPFRPDRPSLNPNFNT